MKLYPRLTAYFLVFCLVPIFTFFRPALAQQNNPEIQSEFKDPFADPFEKKQDQEPKTTLPDPLEPYNRAIFTFNDFFYEKIMVPTSRGYRFVTTRGIRNSVSNFFSNLKEPVYFVNSILQGEGSDAHTAFARFTVNSTFGLAGLFDVVGDEPAPAPRSLNQTLARWHVGSGFYIVWPLAGGTSLRGTAGMAGDNFLNLVSHTNTETSLYASGLDNINSAHGYLEQYRDLKKYNLDPYVALKNYYASQEYGLHK
jgi:phospholipid-binding lipoprotein MlaA